MRLFKNLKNKVFEVIRGNSLNSKLCEFNVIEGEELFDLFGGTVWGCTGAAGQPPWHCILGDPTKCS